MKKEIKSRDKYYTPTIKYCIMKYFMDFEFLEGDIPQRICGFNIPRWLSKPNNTIQPISIGLVSSDGREYYAISKDFNLKEAWNRYDLKTSTYTKNFGPETEEVIKKVYWIRNNVLKPIYYDLLKIGNIYGDERNHWSFTYSNLKRLLKWYGKTNKQISEEVKEFIYKGSECSADLELWGKDINIEFYAYYADYDWVAFCWLFGKMNDLPKGFPMYCRDLKQILDEKEVARQDGADMVELRNMPNYPKQTNEHNALDDAKWNKELYEFLNKI